MKRWHITWSWLIVGNHFVNIHHPLRFSISNSNAQEDEKPGKENQYT